MENTKEILKIFETLKDMNEEERVELLKNTNISKTLICDSLLNNPQFAKIPMKSLVINAISGMGDEEFLHFVASNVGKVPTSVLSKVI